MTPQPPRLAQRILRLVLPSGSFGEALLGDLHEEFVHRAKQRTRFRAANWYRYQAFRIASRFAMRTYTPFSNHSPPVRLPASTGRSGGHRMSVAWQDVRYAVRMLVRRPMFAATVVLTLSLGIGANAAIFTVVNGVLLEPLVFPQSDRLVNVWGRFLPESGFDFPSFPLSEPEYIDYRDHNVSMQDVSLFTYYGANIIDDAGEPDRVAAAAITANMFTVLGVSPMLGRPISAADDVPGGSGVVLLSDGLWRSRFGADTSVIGRTLSINGRSSEVIGVMPPGFDEAFPAAPTALWSAYQLDEANPGDRQSHNSMGIARLASNVTLPQAEAELATMMAQWKADFPEIHSGHFLFVRPLIEDVVGNVRTALLLLLGAVGFVLLLVCANVANLLLARSEQRRRELALRRALGASRGRILQQLLTESFVLGALGGVLGLAMALGGTNILLSMQAGSIPRTEGIGVDPTVLLFTAVITIATSAVFGLMPALQAASSNVRSAMHETTRSVTAGTSRVLFRRILVVAEMALSVLLVTGAGLMVRSFARLASEDPGFRVENLLVFPASLPGGSYTSEQALAFHTELLTELRAMPGVVSAASISSLPISQGRGMNDFVIEGRPEPASGEVAWNAAFASPSAGYFETMQIPVLGGRTFDDADDAGSMPVAIVNETFATRFLEGDAVGQRIRMAGSGSGALWRTIVGVVGNEKYEGVSFDPRPGYYFPRKQAMPDYSSAARFQNIVVETRDDPLTVAPTVRAVVRRLDPSLPIVGMRSMTDVLHSSIARTRFVMTLLVVFAGVALVLGAVGIYGVMAYGVAERTGEIGIRIALGARATQVLGMVVGQGMGLAIFGVAVGLIGAFALTRFMQSQLFEISPTDPVTFGLVAAILSGVALLASYLPARRAASVDPITALRSD